LGTLVRSRSLKGAGPVLAWAIAFITFSLAEFFLLRYYELVGDPFAVSPPRLTPHVDAWFYALASVLLAFAAIVTLAFYLMELKILYLVPLAGLISALYITYFAYRLVGVIFFTYIASLVYNPLLSVTMMILIGGALLSGTIAVALLHYIYLRTGSMRALSFGIGTFIAGMLVLGVDYLLSMLPIAVVGRVLPQREAYLAMLRDWPLNLLYILAIILMFLGQTRVLDAIFKSRSKREKAWIERMMESE
ncbi:MAG: hypothetical protein BA066_07810, partial [Candidatus Korarchaeota archaeon NZ13-K]